MNVSKNGERASSVERALTSESTVLDFLYYDARRVGSYLAQFDPAGHLQGFKEQEQHGSNSGFKSTVAADAGIPAVAKAAGAYENSGQSSEGGQAERHYDPFWVNAISFLDFLQDRKLIADSIENAAIGTFAAVSCGLELRDLGLLSRLVQMPNLRNALIGPEKSPGLTEREAELEVLSAMRLEIEAVGHRDGQPLWCTLKEDCMSIGVSDMLLKHGTKIAGEWTVVGIVDARAFEGEEPRKLTHEEGYELGQQGIRGLITTIYAAMRVELGRPFHAHAMTPLLIFREIRSSTNA